MSIQKGKVLKNGVSNKRVPFGTPGESVWEADRIRPRPKGGSGYFSNLQPLHWKTIEERDEKRKQA